MLHDTAWRKCVQGDILDKEFLKNAFKDADCVHHLAAQISIVGPMNGLVKRINVDGVQNVVSACLESGVKRLVHYSSIHAFKQTPLDQPITETRDFVDETGYAYDHSKALGFKEVQKGVQNGLDAVILHPTGIVGPYDFKPSRMGQVLLDLYYGKLPSNIEGGFNWVDVRDVVKGALLAEKHGKTGENYILSGDWKSIDEVSRTVGIITGKPMPKWTSPMWLAKVGAPFAELFAKLTNTMPLYTAESLGALRANKHMSHDKAKDAFGYAPRPFEESIRDTFTWLKESSRI